MDPIIIAVLIVGGLGLLCSLLLVVATHFFRIKEEEKLIEIRKALPGVNCGACGYSGCDQYARALADGKAAPNLCVPGSVSVAETLSSILGVEVVVDEPKVAYVICNGNCEAANKKAVCDYTASCAASTYLYGGPNSCSYGCLGCGDCAKVCPTDAICFKDGVARINSKICIGCGMCVSECPKKVIVLHSRENKIAVTCNSLDKGAVARKNCKNACIGCKKCELNCPTGAIKVENNLARIDYEKCTSCGKCAEVCPTGCIHNVDFSAPKEI